MARQLLPRAFYLRETEEVARALLGCLLVRRTPRVLPMWGDAGHAYVYRIYGLHSCLNVVTREEGIPEAVLIRAAVPERGWRGEAAARHELLEVSGPGRLCRSLGIEVSLSGASLSGPDLEVRRGPRRAFEVLRGPRVGVDYAGEPAAWPLRLALADCPAVTGMSSLPRPPASVIPAAPPPR